MPRDPREFLRFLADNYDALHEMCREQARFISDEEIAAFLSRREAQPRNPARRVSRMKEVGLLHCGASEWSPPAFLVRFLRDLHHHHSLATPEVINGWIHALEQSVADLEATLDGEAGFLADSAAGEPVPNQLEQIRDTILAIVVNVERNCEQIAHEVAEFRTLEDSGHIRGRLRRLIRLHDNYLEPIVRILDVSGAFYTVVDRVVSACRKLETSESTPQSRLADAARSLLSEVMWMRGEILARAHEAKQELGPLCEIAARESRIANGVNRALEAIRQGDWERLEVPRRLPIADHKTQQLFSDPALRSHLEVARKGVAPAPKLPSGMPRRVRPAWSVNELLEALEQAGPVDDLLEWIEGRCRGIGADEAADLLQGIVNGRPDRVVPAGLQRTYYLADLAVTAVRWSWEPTNGNCTPAANC